MTKQNKQRPISPGQIMWLIEHGREHEIPKSKTWHKFMDYFKKNGMPYAQMAKIIGIPLKTMEKFMTGTYIISRTNMNKIQGYLKSLDYNHPKKSEEL